MVKVKRVLISTYGRALRKLNVARRRLPHDRLVLICDSSDKDIPAIKENMEERGGEFVLIKVDPYDFEDCLNICYTTIEAMKPREIKVNISCGPKTLVGAMLFAAFHSGVEVYNCDVDRRTGKELVIRLPVMTDFELRKRFTEEDWRVVRLLGRPRRRGYISKRSGMSNSALDKALARLEREGVLVPEIREGKLWTVPTTIGQFYSKLAPKKRER